MVGRETDRSAAQSEKAAAACDWAGLDWVGSTGQWWEGGHLPGWTMGNQGTGKAWHGARHGQAGQGRAGHGWQPRWHWALGTGRGRLGTGNSKTVHRPHANQNRLDPPDGDGPRDQQGEPLLGVYQQLSRPERLKRRDLAHACFARTPRTVCPGPYCEIWPSQPLRRLATRAHPQFETPRETRYPSWPWHPPSCHSLPPS